MKAVRTLVPALDLKVQHRDSKPHCLGQREMEKLSAQPMPANFGNQVEVVDESVAAAVLDAEAQGDDDVAAACASRRMIQARAKGSPLAICLTAASPAGVMRS